MPRSPAQLPRSPADHFEGGEEEPQGFSDVLQAHVPELVLQCLVPVADSSLHGDALEFCSHQLAYKVKRPARVSEKIESDLPFTRGLLLWVEVAKFQA